MCRHFLISCVVVLWYYYKGYRLPCLDRGSYVYNPTELSIPYAGMLDNLIGNWMDSFTPEEQRELLQLQQEVKKNRITMETYAPGVYSGAVGSSTTTT